MSYSVILAVKGSFITVWLPYQTYTFSKQRLQILEHDLRVYRSHNGLSIERFASARGYNELYSIKKSGFGKIILGDYISTRNKALHALANQLLNKES